MIKKHFSIRISGLVQGVYFRASTKQKADSLGVTGFVRNEPDGSVYIEVEGEDDALKEFIAWCGRGPSRAVVEKCDVRQGLIKNFSRFTVEQ